MTKLKILVVTILVGLAIYAFSRPHIQAQQSEKKAKEEKVISARVKEIKAKMLERQKDSALRESARRTKCNLSVPEYEKGVTWAFKNTINSYSTTKCVGSSESFVCGCEDYLEKINSIYESGKESGREERSENTGNEGYDKNN